MEFDTVVPPSEVVTIAGAQQVWVAKNYAQRTVVMWAWQVPGNRVKGQAHTGRGLCQ